SLYRGPARRRRPPARTARGGHWRAPVDGPRGRDRIATGSVIDPVPAEDAARAAARRAVPVRDHPHAHALTEWVDALPRRPVRRARPGRCGRPRGGPPAV